MSEPAKPQRPTRLPHIVNEPFFHLFRPGTYGRLLATVPDISRYTAGSDSEEAIRSTYRYLELGQLPAHRTGSKWALDVPLYNAHVYAQQRRAFRSEEHEALVRLIVVFDMLMPALEVLDDFLASEPDQYVELTPVLAEAITSINRLLRRKPV